MSVLSPLEIAAYARQAGFPDDTLVTMTAGALAESGGNPFAHNNNPATGDNSKGLLQVNMRGALGPDRRKRFGLASDDELFNPATNMRVAKGIFDSQGLGAWGAIRTGAYKKFLPQAQDAVARLLGGEVPDLGRSFSAAAPVAGSAGALQQLAQSILEGNLDSASRPTASDPLARIAQAGLVDPFAPKPARMAASGDFFQAMAGLSGGLTEPVAAAVRNVMGGGAPANNIRPLDISAGAPMPAEGGAVPIAQVGRALEQAGLRVREHPDFGGVGKHSPGSLHYKGLALDLTDWQDPGEKESSWRPRKAALGQRMAEILGPAAQVLHPGNDGAHGSHIHLGIPSGRLTLDQVQKIVQARQETLRAFPFRWAG